MDTLLSAKRVGGFERILKAYARSGNPLHNAIDGGAGSGTTAEIMAKHLAEGSFIYAFEPFPGNHRFFEGRDPRIILRKEALAEQRGTVSFNVRSVVDEGSAWGKRGMAGYSSAGRISPAGRPGQNFEVQAIAGDEAVPDPCDIDFVKLDLEGGEINALAGMSIILEHVHFLWVEFKGQADLLEDLVRRELLLSDTAYLFLGEMTSDALALFQPARREVTLSSGAKAWTGFRRTEWTNYLGTFRECVKSFRMVQTDLVAVNPQYLDEFIQMLGYLDGDT
jgi:FkbM family methyltransferase